MKKLLVVLAAVVTLTTATYAEDAKKIGLSFGTDYYSTYLFRGAEWMAGQGAFAPYVSYDIAGTGLVVSVAGEIAPNQLTTTTDAIKRQSIDFALSYSYTIAKLVTLSANATYWLYPSDNTNLSFLTATVGVGFNVLLKPTISYTHDFYFGINQYQDFYLTLSVGHDFDLGKGVTLGLGLSASMYNIASMSKINYLNDLTATIKLGVDVSGIGLYGSYNALYVPNDTRGFVSFFKLGASYAL